ncbi:MAG: DUF2489 domain-containing protein [Pseudomonadota bacterium]
MPEYMTNETYVLSIRQRVVVAAGAMLNGTLSFLAGSRLLAALRHEAAVREDDADFRVFVAIDSETDDLPIGTVRQYWDKQALEKLEPEIQAAEVWAKEQGSKACESLISRFQEKTGV